MSPLGLVADPTGHTHTRVFPRAGSQTARLNRLDYEESLSVSCQPRAVALFRCNGPLGTLESDASADSIGFP